MRIRIKGDGHNISIPIPTGLIFSKPSVWLYLKLARKYSSRASEFIPEDIEIKVEPLLDKLPDAAVYALCEEILRIRKKHGHWDLVEVHTADGEHIQITL
jgi:hypothetical protein